MVDFSEVEVIVPAFRRCWKRNEAPAKPVPAALGRNAPRRAENRNGLDMMVNVEQTVGCSRELTFADARRRDAGSESECTSESFDSESPRGCSIQSTSTTTTTKFQS